ncbi:MAG: FAD-dependent oxidoreductase [Methylococcales bacterium]|nr:FAD-dependent oxidoreductase [Methylococcales bacterium]
MSDQTPIIIIGTGLAGYNLGKEFRKIDRETPLVYITADDGRSYSKPMLSTGFTKEKSADDLAMADADTMAQQLKASVRTMTQVTAIDAVKQEIAIGDEKISYSKLVLAVGAKCIEASLQGNAVEDVYSINDLMEYARFRQAIEEKKKIFIIGAGLIGCEYANDLSNGGYNVESVEPLSTVLATLLPEAASHAVQSALETEKNVKFHFDTVAKAVNKRGDGYEITLGNGQKKQADAVLSAIGVRANTALAETAGLTLNRGIVANRQLQTSDPNIYALGDCAEVDGQLLYYVMPLMTCARTLAKTLSGTPTPVAYGPMPVAVKVPVCPVQVSPAPRDVEGNWEIEQDGHSVKALFRDKSGQLRGFALTGEKVSEKMALQKELPPILA